MQCPGNQLWQSKLVRLWQEQIFCDSVASELGGLLSCIRVFIKKLHGYVCIQRVVLHRQPLVVETVESVCLVPALTFLYHLVSENTTQHSKLSHLLPFGHLFMPLLQRYKVHDNFHSYIFSCHFFKGTKCMITFIVISFHATSSKVQSA